MKIRFLGWDLVDENGEVVFISKEKLKEECFKNPKQSVSIKKIVSTAIHTLGYEVIWGMSPVSYTKSDLYAWLEKHINSNPRYQSLKTEVYIQQQKIRDERRKERIIDSYYPAYIDQQIEKEYKTRKRTEEFDPE